MLLQALCPVGTPEQWQRTLPWGQQSIAFLCVCVCVCRGCGRLRVRVGWQVPHCLRHFCPNSAKRRKPWHPLPRPLPQSFPNGFRGASMSTHPSLPTCSPEPRATGLLCFSLSSLPSHSGEGHFLPPSLSLSAEEWAVAKGRRRRRAAHPRADQQSTPHQRVGDGSSQSP